MKLWVNCVDASGTKWLKEGEKYLIQVYGTKVKILRSLSNPHLRLGTFNKNRFKNEK